MKRRFNTWWVLPTALLALITTGSFADEVDSGFLTDYSQLKPVAGTGIRMYTAPDFNTDLKNYTAVMIDQPEFVIADDSKYKGFKLDDVKAVADALRQQFTDAVSKNITVVDKAGPGVLYVRIAASNVHLKKKSRGLLGYTPAGFVVTTAVASGQAMEQKVILQDMNLEMEVQDSQSQAVCMGMLMPFFDLISSAMVIGDFLLPQKMAHIYAFWLRRCRGPVLIPWYFDTAWHSLTSMLERNTLDKCLI